jgi:hypothetical protein
MISVRARCAASRFGVLVEKARVVDPRAEGGEEAARIVIPVVDARLIPERRTPEEDCLALDEQHGAARRSEHERQPGTVETTADDGGVKMRHSGHQLTTRPTRRCHRQPIYSAAANPSGDT